jgi:hypothetical protein
MDQKNGEQNGRCNFFRDCGATSFSFRFTSPISKDFVWVNCGKLKRRFKKQNLFVKLRLGQLKQFIDY